MVHPQCLLGFQVFFIAQSQFFLQVLGGCVSQFIIAKRQVLAFLGIGKVIFIRQIDFFSCDQCYLFTCFAVKSF